MTEAQRVFYQEAVGQLAALRERPQPDPEAEGAKRKPRRLKGEAWAAIVEKAKGGG